MLSRNIIFVSVFCLKMERKVYFHQQLSFLAAAQHIHLFFKLKKFLNFLAVLGLCC